MRWLSRKERDNMMEVVKNPFLALSNSYEKTKELFKKSYPAPSHEAIIAYFNFKEMIKTAEILDLLPSNRIKDYKTKTNCILAGEF